MSNPLKPGADVLVRLGSLAVHVDEFISEDGHEADLHAIKSLLDDDILKNWLEDMRKGAWLPVKRKE